MFEDINLLRWLLGVFALVFMFGGLVLILQKLQRGGGFKPHQQGRLKVVDSLSLDARRKVVLIQDGSQEHLIMLGVQQETLLRSGKKQTIQEKKKCHD